MPFATPLAIAIYFTIWWIVLLAMLPIGMSSTQEENDERPAGADPGAPAAPKLAMKAALTTVVAALVFAIVVIAAKVMDFE
jgi:predicted secreted protein